MSRIFIAGMSPLPFENDRKVYGTGIRTWQFILPLLKKGHRICACNYAIPSAYPEDFRSKYNKHFTYGYSSLKREEGPDGDRTGREDKGIKNSGYEFEYNVLKKEDFENTGVLSKIFTEFKPDCLVGCTFYPSYTASKLLEYKKIPFWADLFGHVMAEAQARAYMDESDGCLFHYWNSEYNIISRADIFSCVSSRQKYALVGELGTAGRLNRYTSGYDFADVIPCGIPENDYRHTGDVIRGKDGVTNEDFVVLWTGGYNTWTDVDTLFRGLESAMEKNPKIKFVSTGGEIPEQDTKTYPHFLSMIDKSPYKDRFIMRGWVPGEDVPNYYLEADAGINIDRDIYEVKLGSKNRILDWFRAGLCVLSSNVCELTDIIEKEKIGYTFKPCDYRGLGEKLIYLAGNRDEAEKTAIAGRKYAAFNFSFDKTTAGLQGWAENPVFSPDSGKKRELVSGREEALKKLQNITLEQKRMVGERDRRISELEGIVKKSFIYRIYSYFRIAGRKIFH
ncbi:MAG: glycosyltransferase family 4 protein [Actinomycetota bacterium]|nr:glycosyltransferase family 4 protein [Actinomycetota bacterium]